MSYVVLGNHAWILLYSFIPNVHSFSKRSTVWANLHGIFTRTFSMRSSFNISNTNSSFPYCWISLFFLESSPATFTWLLKPIRLLESEFASTAFDRMEFCVVSLVIGFLFVLLSSFDLNTLVCAFSVVAVVVVELVCVLLLSMISLSSVLILLCAAVFCAHSIPRYRLAISHPISSRFSSYSNSYLWIS